MARVVMNRSSPDVEGFWATTVLDDVAADIKEHVGADCSAVTHNGTSIFNSYDPAKAPGRWDDHERNAFMTRCENTASRDKDHAHMLDFCQDGDTIGVFMFAPSSHAKYAWLYTCWRVESGCVYIRQKFKTTAA